MKLTYRKANYTRVIKLQDARVNKQPVLFIIKARGVMVKLILPVFARFKCQGNNIAVKEAISSLFVQFPCPTSSTAQRFDYYWKKFHYKNLIRKYLISLELRNFYSILTNFSKLLSNNIQISFLILSNLLISISKLAKGVFKAVKFKYLI